MRTLNGHKVNHANDRLDISVLDEPGAGGACHHYRVTGFEKIPPTKDITPECNDPHADVIFQNGTIPESGVNGLTHEVLLEIVADRLRSFQSGPYKCKANACALTHIEEAQHWLQQRTIERMRRGVEGTNAT